ncbi:Coenzyme F420 hydrogenase/dehydrogenase, beta subunit C-terminal domain [Algoriella sp.]|uniref:Coenzyme F420 hydrogenase/dehydrogenase, beta subunit C-terminal domain n=1 Tax=Algoriella sp. TaxID=1872434 RepID=UPI001B05A353|nr:Coenzyme F420 hydrogenase/dehydrogenase, beta subunit C-terminal domain [Algoriella sp.]MBO6213492.1 Coenzyme F420 hydrogenase/dehydrogenase, beta subunit C-terminal domain [Algoriella sp.]
MKYTIKDIVTNDLCVGCGVCTSTSKSSKMNWNEEGFLVPILDDSFSENAIKLCPFNPNPEKEVKDEDILADALFPSSKQKDVKIGRFENTYVGYSHEYRNTSSSGGIATFVFEKLLKDKIVDHLFIVKEINGTYQYQWFDNFENIKEISKTRYIPVTMGDLFKEIDSKEGKVAVSGVACFIKAIRLKQHYNPQYKEKIPFLVGIICGGLKSRFFTDFLAQSAGIEGKYSKQEYRIKDEKSSASDYSFGAYNSHKEFHQLKMKTVGDLWGTGLFKANACDFCDDVTTELADISLGDAWLPEYNEDGLGNSVIITRSKLADSLITKGIDNKELSVKKVTKEKIIQSQNASFKHRQNALKYRLRKFDYSKLKKRKRFLVNIPFEFKVVQDMRRKTRKNSLVFWKNNRTVTVFVNKISLDLKKLAKKTKYYHYIQAIKRKLKLKTI